jgi:hypothetical protein
MPDNYDAPEKRTDRLQAALARYQEKPEEDVTPFAEQVAMGGGRPAGGGERAWGQRRVLAGQWGPGPSVQRSCLEAAGCSPAPPPPAKLRRHPPLPSPCPAPPPPLQERWEAEQLKRTKGGVGSTAGTGQVGGQQYDLLLEDQIDFIRDAVIKGDIDPVGRLVGC